jgi:ribonuclease HI
MYWVSGHAGVQGNEIANRLAKDGFVQKSVGPELSLGVSTKNIKKKINHLADNQHLAMWRGPSK